MGRPWLSRILVKMLNVYAKGIHNPEHWQGLVVSSLCIALCAESANPYHALEYVLLDGLKTGYVRYFWP